MQSPTISKNKKMFHPRDYLAKIIARNFKSLAIGTFHTGAHLFVIFDETKDKYSVFKLS